MSKNALAPEPYVMKFDPMTIEHLGLRLYSTLPPVLNELVSNAFDSDSPRVEIVISEGEITEASTVVIRDYGHALSDEELRSEYLPVGRCRRGADGSASTSKSGERKVTGRKGLGKLSVFGVADTMILRTIQSSSAICLEFSFTEMQEWAIEHGPGAYQPRYVPDLSGSVDEPDGVELTLRGLRRKTPVNLDALRRGLARRLTCIGPAFEVLVNNVPLGPGDRVTRQDCPEGESWAVEDLPDGGGDLGGGFVVSGWIGFLKISSQNNRGVDLYAHAKAAELGSFFNQSSTHAQFARAHLVGAVHADFLDEGEDLVSTARNGVVWDSELGQRLERWGQQALKHVFDQWLIERRSKKERAITKVARFDEWVKTRTVFEQKAAMKMVGLLIDDPNIEMASTESLLEVIKSSVESVGFHELLSALEDNGVGAGTLLNLFSEWRVVEAREHLKLADGRRSAIKQLKAYIDQGALEVQEIQPLFEGHPWILDSAWDGSTGQTTYTQMLRDFAKESKKLPEKDRRLDILGISVGGVLTVVELKRPQNTVTRDNLTQIERYVDWANDNLLGTGDGNPALVRGLLIVGKQNPNLSRVVGRLVGAGIKVETFSDIYERIRQDTLRMDATLQLVAPEYAKDAAKRRGAGSQVEATAPAVPKAAKKKRKAKKRRGKRNKGE